MKKIKCFCCEKEINPENEFYKINGEFYCDECLVKKTVYTFKDEEDKDFYDKDEVEEFHGLKEYINDLKSHRKLLLEWAKETKDSFMSEKYRKRAQEIAAEIKELESE